MIHAHLGLTLSTCTSAWVISVLQYKYGAKEITIQRHFCSPFIFNFHISFTSGTSSLELPNNCSDIHLSNSLLYETSVLLWAKFYLCWKSFLSEAQIISWKFISSCSSYKFKTYLLVKLSRTDSSVCLPNHPNKGIEYHGFYISFFWQLALESPKFKWFCIFYLLHFEQFDQTSQLPA